MMTNEVGKLLTAAEVAVAHLLLGSAPQSEPRTRATGLGGLLPGDEGALLVIGPVARAAGDEPGLARDIGVRVPGQWLHRADRRIEVTDVQEAASLLV